MRLTAISFFIFVLVSCQSKETEKKSAQSPKKEIKDRTTFNTDSSIIDEIPFDAFQYANEIDSIVKKNQDAVKRFSWFAESKRLADWKKPNQGEDEVFYIYQDSRNHVLHITIFPISHSGDWFEYETYIFDTLGRTIAHSFHHSTFVSDCGQTRLNIRRWYNREFSLLKEEREQLDADEKKVENKDCFPRTKVLTVSNLEELSKRDGLTNALAKIHQ